MGVWVGPSLAGLMGALIAGDTLEAVGVGFVVGVVWGLTEWSEGE